MAVRRAAMNIAIEALLTIQRNGRPLPRMAESWSVSDHGRLLRIHLPPSLTFHSGRPATAAVIRSILLARAPAALGPIYSDVQEIRAPTDREVEFVLRQPSPFVLERLDDDIPFADPDSPSAGTGPFYVSGQGREIAMPANAGYHGGKPLIDQISFKPYSSVRAAWADMLRGQVDMLYDVGSDAFESLESSSQVKIFRFQRGYAYVVLLNLRKPYLNDARFRRELNAAIDRSALVAEVFRGHGIPADAAILPQHWAFATDLPRFRYDPHPVDVRHVKPRLKCLFTDSSLERLALIVQRQLQATGVDLDIELVSAEQAVSRLVSGDFDAVLGDVELGPNLARSYLFWHSGAPNNWGGYVNPDVDKALDSIRHAPSDDAYRNGVAAFERAIVDDPPAIFLAWGERARVVSTRFEVAPDPDNAVLRTLQLWRPAEGQRMARQSQK